MSPFCSDQSDLNTLDVVIKTLQCVNANFPGGLLCTKQQVSIFQQELCDTEDWSNDAENSDLSRE